MQTSELATTLLILAIVVFAIFRQVMPRKVRRLTFIVLPLLAAYEAYRSLPQPTIPLHDLVECLVMLLVALIAGFIQAMATRVFMKNDQLYMQGGWMSLVAWVGLVVVRMLIEFLFQGPGFYTSFQSHEWILWAAVAVTFGTKSAILYWRHPEIGMALSNEKQDRRRRRDF